MVHSSLKIVILLINLWNFVEPKKFNCLSNIKDNKNNFVEFENISTFTDAMCAQCYWFLAEIPKVWKNNSLVDVNMVPIYKPTVRMCFPKFKPTLCPPFKYNRLNITNKDKDFFLRQFRTHFHMVCSHLLIKCQIARLFIINEIIKVNLEHKLNISTTIER